MKTIQKEKADDQLVYVYYNLHRHLWSVRALTGPNRGRVVSHERSLVLAGVKPKVSEAGRQRVIREGKKNVHAGLVGRWTLPDTIDGGRWNGISTPITYNPYKYTSFVYKDDETEYKGSDNARLSGRDVTVWSD